MALLEASFDNNNWIALPDPEAGNYDPTYTHLEKSFRDSMGYFHRDIQRRNLFKAIVGWARVNSTEMSFLQSLYDKDFFYLKCTDNYGNRIVKKVYAGPLTGPAKYADPKTYLLVLRTKVSMNFIEY